MFNSHLDYFRKLPLGSRPNTKLRDHHTLHAHNRWIIQFYRVWRPAWININSNNIWLRAWSHMASHDTWGFVTTPDNFVGVLGRPMDTFYWARTISWSWLLACVWSDANTRHENNQQRVERNTCCGAIKLTTSVLMSQQGPHDTWHLFYSEFASNMSLRNVIKKTSHMYDLLEFLWPTSSIQYSRNIIGRKYDCWDLLRLLLNK